MLAPLDVASVSLPGFFLAKATSSATDFTGRPGRTKSMLVAKASELTGANAWSH